MYFFGTKTEHPFFQAIILLFLKLGTFGLLGTQAILKIIPKRSLDTICYHHYHVLVKKESSFKATETRKVFKNLCKEEVG